MNQFDSNDISKSYYYLSHKKHFNSKHLILTFKHITYQNTQIMYINCQLWWPR